VRCPTAHRPSKYLVLNSQARVLPSSGSSCFQGSHHVELYRLPVAAESCKNR
jgi:hypothetical protein